MLKLQLSDALADMTAKHLHIIAKHLHIITQKMHIKVITLSM